MNIFIIDLDKKKSYIKSDETFPNFPSKLTSALEKDIKSFRIENKNVENYITKKTMKMIIIIVLIISF